MKSLVVENIRKVKKAVPRIEKRTKVKISFGSGGRVFLKGSELEEFVVEKIVEAVDFGFDLEDAFLLLREDFVLKFIDIKSFTRRKNLKDVRSRVIGKRGKAIKTIEELSGCVMVVHDNCVGVIVDSLHLEAVVQAIQLLIQGAKHGNVFAYLERQNKEKSKFEEDLGLRDERFLE